jgi:SPP1 family phage portal protein
MRVIGWQVNMLRLELSAQVTERKFKKAYQRQYKMLTDFWRQTNKVTIDPVNLSFTFTRKFPKDVDQEIDMLVKGMGVLPLEKLYSLVSFIDNPAELAEQLRKEKPEARAIEDTLDDTDDAE